MFCFQNKNPFCPLLMKPYRIQISKECSQGRKLVIGKEINLSLLVEDESINIDERLYYVLKAVMFQENMIQKGLTQMFKSTHQQVYPSQLNQQPQKLQESQKPQKLSPDDANQLQDADKQIKVRKKKKKQKAKTKDKLKDRDLDDIGKGMIEGGKEYFDYKNVVDSSKEFGLISFRDSVGVNSREMGYMLQGDEKDQSSKKQFQGQKMAEQKRNSRLECKQIDISAIKQRLSNVNLYSQLKQSRMFY